MRPLCFCLPVLAVLAVSPALRADTYNLKIVTADTSSTPGSSFTVSGVISGPADPYTAGAFDIDTISGGANIYTFSGIEVTGSDSFIPSYYKGFTFNNVLYTDPGSTYADSYGFLLDLSSPLGTSLAHVYYGSSGYEVDVVDPNDPGDVTPFHIDSLEITPSTVPEPSTFALLGTGLLGLSAAARRRFRR